MANHNRVVVSFKSTEEDQELLREISESSDKSAYVKDRLKKLKKLEKEMESLRGSSRRRSEPRVNFGG